jgi:hypothetical protein
MRQPLKFDCPTCGTAYQVVRVEATTGHDRPLLCLSCGGPLRNRDGKYALKYFKTGGSRRLPMGRRPKLV